jgi:hypothetical protein
MGDNVIICGDGPHDLPYTKYHIIRGPRFDQSIIIIVPPSPERINSRSVYGIKKIRDSQGIYEAEIRSLKKLNKKHFRARRFIHFTYKKSIKKLFTKNNKFYEYLIIKKFIR